MVREKRTRGHVFSSMIFKMIQLDKYSVPCPRKDRKILDRHYGEIAWFEVKKR